jgi:large subunit ribosomal protein L25
MCGTWPTRHVALCHGMVIGDCIAVKNGMSSMQLKVNKRSIQTKGAINQLRENGGIPAVLYAKGKETITLSLEAADLQKILRGLKPGTLSTLVLELEGLGRPVRAIVKEVQYNKTNYSVLHVDLMELVDNQTLLVKVPVELTGINDCAGVKAGGAVRQVMRSVTVECTPEAMPREFQVDVRELNIGQSKRVESIRLPAGVRCKEKLVDVLAVVAKR